MGGLNPKAVVALAEVEGASTTGRDTGLSSSASSGMHSTSLSFLAGRGRALVLLLTSKGLVEGEVLFPAGLLLRELPLELSFPWGAARMRGSLDELLGVAEAAALMGPLRESARAGVCLPEDP